MKRTKKPLEPKTTEVKQTESEPVEILEQDESLKLNASDPDTITPDDYEVLEIPELEDEDITMPGEFQLPNVMIEPGEGLEVPYDDSMPARAEYLSELGLLDKGLAIAFGVNINKIRSWKCSYPAFREQIKRGKKKSGQATEQNLYRKANGFYYVEERAFLSRGEVLKEAVRKYSIPSDLAIFYILQNRDPDRWQNVSKPLDPSTRPRTYPGGAEAHAWSQYLKIISDKDLHMLSKIQERFEKWKEKWDGKEVEKEWKPENTSSWEDSPKL